MKADQGVTRVFPPRAALLGRRTEPHADLCARHRRRTAKSRGGGLRARALLETPFFSGLLLPNE